MSVVIDVERRSNNAYAAARARIAAVSPAPGRTPGGAGPRPAGPAARGPLRHRGARLRALRRHRRGEGRGGRHRPRRTSSRRCAARPPTRPRPPKPTPRSRWRPKAPAAATSTSCASPCRTRPPWPIAASREPPSRGRGIGGVVIDISRKRVLLDGEPAAAHLQGVRAAAVPGAARGPHDRAGRARSPRCGAPDDDEAPNERTIDVHVRRLRAKLGGYEDIVRTVRGVGYRFDRHADVSVRHASTPSPDFF